MKVIFLLAGNELDGVLFHNNQLTAEMPELKPDDAITAASVVGKGDDASLDISGVVVSSSFGSECGRRGQIVMIESALIHYTDSRQITTNGPFSTKDFIVIVLYHSSS